MPSSRRRKPLCKTAFLLCFLLAGAAGFSQTVTLSVKGSRIDSVFSLVKAQTGFVFFCSADILTDSKPVSITVSNMELPTFLDKLFHDLPLKYSIKNKTIIVSKKPDGANTGKEGAYPNVRAAYLPTVMEGGVPRYTYRLTAGITDDRHGMVILTNEKIFELLDG